MENTSDKFSKLNPSELQEMILYILKENLEYRDNLDIKDNITFGIEIEYESLLKIFIDKYIKKNYSSWKVKSDESLILGSEIISPVMNDEIIYWKQLKEICIYLKKRNVITDDNAAGHIHIGTHIIGKSIEKWRKFIKTYAIYEDILFRFLYGDKISARKKILDYSRPISDLIANRIDKLDKLEDIRQIKSALPPYSKGQAINFMNINTLYIDSFHEKNTVEFRSPNATVDEIVWQNNINALIKLIINSEKIDEEFLDYKIKTGALDKKTYSYNEINLKKALEFIDLIFESEIDKLYFLKQYIKDFQAASNLPFEQMHGRR